jgi:hypothetical protein
VYAGTGIQLCHRILSTVSVWPAMPNVLTILHSPTTVENTAVKPMNSPPVVAVRKKKREGSCLPTLFRFVRPRQRR